MEMQKGNTTLIVIIIILIVGFGVWYITDHNKRDDNNAGINVTVPLGDDDGTADQGSGDR